MLCDDDDRLRESAAAIAVALLKQRKPIVAELLNLNSHEGAIGVNVEGGGGSLPQNFVMDGFQLLMYTNERRMSNVSLGKNSQFFEWLADNETHVEGTFDLIAEKAAKSFLRKDLMDPSAFVTKIQKEKVQSMGGKRVHSEVMFKFNERAERVGRAEANVQAAHEVWMKRGFDELTAGAMLYKRLLRELKGELGVWERANKGGGVRRWKLDLCEGPERTRRKMLQNYEFYEVYNVGEGGEEEEGTEGGGGGMDADDIRLELSKAASSVSDPNVMSMIESDAVEDVAAFVKQMNLIAGKGGSGGGGEGEEEEGGEEEGGEEEGGEQGGEGGSVEEEEEEEEEEEKMESRARVGSEDSSVSHDSATSDATGVSEAPKHRGTPVVASSFELLTGLVHPNDLPDVSAKGGGLKHIFNVQRCTGLEVTQALLFFGKRAVYVIDGFEQRDGDDLDGAIERVEVQESKFEINLRRASSLDMEGGVRREVGKKKVEKVEKEKAGAAGGKVEEEGGEEGEQGEKESAGFGFQHRCQRIPFDELHAVYKRRYQLRQIALEFFDLHRTSVLISFDSEKDRDLLLGQLLKTPLPNSIFNSNKQMLASGSGINYKKFMAGLRNKVTNRWVNGRMTNFEYIMFLNTFAGRSYNDLTQYPVFPWVLSDYTSEEIDLNDPAVYRDLSKPMGAIGESRAEQFRDRFDALADYAMDEHDPPPFHYGTHYSCAGYVLHYLMRLEPYSRLALSLQGGRFDKADRLFRSIGASWQSAAYENLQDVRELTPEFYYLPEFLQNTNLFDFGSTQTGDAVHDVILPPWAKGDANKFITINRMALESDLVSAHLHKWIDLVFGYKQRGREAVAAQNCFVHLTYEGNVDLEKMEDDLEREATIAQIHNFGQTPSRLERKPHASRVVGSILKGVGEDQSKVVDLGAVQGLAWLTPPFCIVGAPHRVYIRTERWDMCRLGLNAGNDAYSKSVGDVCVVKDKLVAVGADCLLLPPNFMKFARFGGAAMGISVHVSVQTPRHRELDKCVASHDGLHSDVITSMGVGVGGRTIVTGCRDSTVRVWRASKASHSRHIKLISTLVGHLGAVSCVAVGEGFNIIVTGCEGGRVVVWDLKRLCYIRCLLEGANRGGGVRGVSVNKNCGSILVLCDGELVLFDVNGRLIARQQTGGLGQGAQGGRRNTAASFPLATKAVSTSCPLWMTAGVVCVSGHLNGDVILWGVDWDEGIFVPLHSVSGGEKVHSCEITSLRVVTKDYCGGLASYGGGVFGGVGGGVEQRVNRVMEEVVGGGSGGGGEDDLLLVGDVSGKVSLSKVLRLDSLKEADLVDLMREGGAGKGGLGGAVL